jgi:hypothetical protein
MMAYFARIIRTWMHWCCQRPGGDSPEAPALAVNEPIAVMNAPLLDTGWSPQPEQEPLPFERERAGNNPVFSVRLPTRA